MAIERLTRIVHRRSWWGAVVSTVLAGAAAYGGFPDRVNSQPVPVDGRLTARPAKVMRGLSECLSDSDCDDANACTTDVCLQGDCANRGIPGCVPCTPQQVCEPFDVVFIMDTSGSMKDEAAALCAGIAQVVAELDAYGVTLNATVLGITETPGGIFSCLSGNVVALLGGAVPGGPTSCVFPGSVSAFESWGPATAIVAQRFPWTAGAKRMIIPIGDEGPCNGSRPDGCNDPGDDRESIENAIVVAGQNNVIVSPITGTGSDTCVTNLAARIAASTGGDTFQTQDPGMDLVGAIVELVLSNCDTDYSCDDELFCTTEDTCIDGVCLGDPRDCSSLDAACVVGVCNEQTDACEERAADDGTPCDDGLFCTTGDTCTDGVCGGQPLDCAYLDDVCVVGVCDEQTDTCGQRFLDFGTPCDDGDECTVNDVCTGCGVCQGTLACGPTLCLEISPGGPPCYGIGEDIVVNVTLTPSSGTPVIVGGQFFFRYPAALLDVIDVSPGRAVDWTSPFDFELFEQVDPEQGTVFYGVGVGLFGQGTPGPAVMATIRFRTLQGCVTIPPLCLLSENPRNTQLTDEDGQDVPYLSCCLGELRVRGPEPILTCPDSTSLNADAGRLTALVTWDTPEVSGGCDATPRCTGQNSLGVDISRLVMEGGRFPQGLSQMKCTATDNCGQTSSCQWSVNVSPANTVELSVQLSPPIADVPLRRCITFEFFASCIEPAEVVEATLDFGPPFDFSGRAKDVVLKVQGGQYACVTARDPLHTLRSVAYLEIVDRKYVATFKGDPFFGGNWLVGGNLNGDHVIDILDFGTYLSQYGRAVSPGSPCGTPGPHADINGDGIVNESDGWFVQTNLAKQDKESCCPSGTGVASEDAPIVEISVRELELMGLDELAAADLNGDGLVNQEDITVFLEGGVPVQTPDHPD